MSDARAETPVERETWRSINTAPKDGRTILGWWEKSQILSPIYWDTKNGEWLEYADVDQVSSPTHWMEIPQPPGWRPDDRRN